jgi:4-amino-4-deoxy-L-arabinose transferase-like glycosyltransferase
MKNKLHLYLLIGCLILGGFLRLVQLSYVPPSLNWDEVSLGYNAYSLLHSGRDEWQVAFPTIFRAYGDYKLPLYVYSAVPTVAAFGLSAAGVRLPSVMAGIGLILLTYLISYRIFTNKQTALIAAFLVATQPWTVFLSRVAVEANLAAFFITLGIYLGLVKRFSLSALLLGLSVWTYNSARFFVPALLLFAIFYFRRRFRNLVLSLLIAAVFLLPMLFQLLQPSGQARLGWLTLLDSGALAQIAASRSASHFPVPRLIYNKVTYFSVHFTANYLSYFSPDFLFFKGGSQYQFNIPGVGLISPVGLVFFYLGLAFLLFTRHKNYRFLLLWLLLAPVAGSITRDSPHTLRAITFLPVPMIIVSYGLTTIIQKLPRLKTFGLAVFTLAIFVYLGVFIANYTQTYRSDYSWAWQYGYSQVVSYISAHYDQYTEIIFTKKYGEPHEFVLFYTSWNPVRYTTDPELVRYFKSDWYWVDAFAHFRFINDWEMPDYVKSLKTPGRYLIVSSPDHPVISEPITQINFLDQKPAFYISQKSL